MEELEGSLQKLSVNNNNSVEHWKFVNIDKFCDIYEISTLGRVRKNQIVMKNFIGKDRYVYIKFSKDSKTQSFSVHRLLALTFLNNYYDKEQVNHKNKIRHDNKIFNLEWNTRKENIAHSKQNCKDISRAVLQYDLSGNFIKEFSSLTNAAIEVYKDKKQGSSISKCCIGGVKTCKGFIWKYKKPNIKYIFDKTLFTQLKNYPDYYINKIGEVYSDKRKKLLKPQDSKGYMRVNIRNDEFVGTKNIHNLMAETFLEKTGYKELVVNHINNIRDDNRLENLEYVTISQNGFKSYYSDGGNNSKKLKKCAQYDLNNNLIKEFPSMRMASRETGITFYFISACCKENNKKHSDFIWKYI